MRPNSITECAFDSTCCIEDKTLSTVLLTFKRLNLVKDTVVSIGRAPPRKLDSGTISRHCDSPVDEVEGASLRVTRYLKSSLDELRVGVAVCGHHSQCVACGVERLKHNMSAGTCGRRRNWLSSIMDTRTWSYAAIIKHPCLLM